MATLTGELVAQEPLTNIERLIEQGNSGQVTRLKRNGERIFHPDVIKLKNAKASPLDDYATEDDQPVTLCFFAARSTNVVLFLFAASCQVMMALTWPLVVLLFTLGLTLYAHWGFWKYGVGTGSAISMLPALVMAVATPIPSVMAWIAVVFLCIQAGVVLVRGLAFHVEHKRVLA